MLLDDRIYTICTILNKVMSTNSLIEKRDIIDSVPEGLKDDFECVVECLSGVHKFGYTYVSVDEEDSGRLPQIWSVRDVINYLLEPAKMGNLTNENIRKHLAITFEYSSFFEPIVNRTLKIGIGKSILPKDGLSAMLAKKYEGRVAYSKSGYYITEKLDGNRCIARYDGTKWQFTSRNGKPMHVNFDMGNLPKEYIYDGEVLSPEQCLLSDNIYETVVNGQMMMELPLEASFNRTSGLINRHSTDKRLVYNIFDIMADVSYCERREVLNSLDFDGDTRLVKVLGHFKDQDSLSKLAPYLLDEVTSMGGEGIMVNLGDRSYTHKRTDGLLKMKNVLTMDMVVVDIQWGTGKYEGQVGALRCECVTDDGKYISCDVGTGLSDEQRYSWAVNTGEIIGKIVEVSYFSLSQTSDNLYTKNFSLRFPRLKGVRRDKTNTSEY